MRLLFWKTNKAKVEKQRSDRPAMSPGEEGELSRTEEERVFVQAGAERWIMGDQRRPTDVPPAVRLCALHAASAPHLSARPSSPSSGLP